MLIERAEDSLAAIRLGDIDALEPPDPAVAPVAPFAGDRGLADHAWRLTDLGDPVAEAIGIGEGRDTPRSRTAGSSTFPSVSRARRRLNSTIARPIGGSSRRGSTKGLDWSSRSRPVAPPDACAAAGFLEHPKLFLGQTRAAFARDLGEHFIEPGVELFFGETETDADLPASPTLAGSATDSASASGSAREEPARRCGASA